MRLPLDRENLDIRSIVPVPTVKNCSSLAFSNPAISLQDFMNPPILPKLPMPSKSWHGSVLATAVVKPPPFIHS